MRGSVKVERDVVVRDGGRVQNTKKRPRMVVEWTINKRNY